MKSKIILFSMCLALIFLSACGSATTPTPTPTRFILPTRMPTPLPSPTPTHTPMPEVRSVCLVVAPLDYDQPIEAFIRKLLAGQGLQVGGGGGICDASLTYEIKLVSY